MSALALQPMPTGRLRVAVAAADPARRTELASILWNAGHEISESPEDADVVLADGVQPDTTNPIVAFGTVDAGQAGLLPQDASPEQIEAAIRAVAAGLAVRGRKAARPAFAAIPEEIPALLTARELEVLSAIGDGLSNKGAARRLGISQHTVKFHVESVLRKLDAASRTEAGHKGLRRGLIEL